MTKFVLALLVAFSSSHLIAANRTPSSENATEASYVGNEVCASCHRSIYQSYSKTSMFHASGRATDGFRPAEFTLAKSDVHYRIYEQDGRVWLSFERPGDPMVRGKRELLYYIGSGRRGMTYLFAVDGYLFESPVNWYGDRRVWDAAPAYQEARQIPMNLPAFTSCLRCHVSGMHQPVSGTENRYPSPAFTGAGVTCERCHGPGSSHVAGGPIVNPAKLSAERRDEVCMQCHLEGKVSIERSARHAYDYKPGDELFDYIRYFVLNSRSGASLGAVSQVEAFSQSKCKEKSGDAMSCTSCHDPHYEPQPVEKISYYRQKCLACHGVGFGAKHYPENPACTGCHMPASPSTDVAHTEVTDHRIPRHPKPSPNMPTSVETEFSAQLVPFPSSEPSDARDRALAWQRLSERGVPTAVSEAEPLLQKALKEDPNDPDVLGALAYIKQEHGDLRPARDLYQRALQRDPDAIDTRINLGVLEAKTGHLADAVKLWQAVFEKAPYRSKVGLNLAYAFCESHQSEQARDYTLRVLEFDPDQPGAKALLKNLSSTPPKCGP